MKKEYFYKHITSCTQALKNQPRSQVHFILLVPHKIKRACLFPTYNEIAKTKVSKYKKGLCLTEKLERKNPLLFLYETVALNSRQKVSYHFYLNYFL